VKNDSQVIFLRYKPIKTFGNGINSNPLSLIFVISLSTRSHQL